MLTMVRAIHEETGLKRLCLAGGVALNSVANGRIVRETPIEELYIQPAAGDSGGAIGAALYAYHALLGKAAHGPLHGPRLLGEGVRRHATSARRSIVAVCATNISATSPNCSTATVADLAAGKVIGWYQGRFEWGPRALGNRSILGRPAPRRDEGHRQHQDQVPRALPAVRPVRAGSESERFFDLPQSERHDPARFMLLVVPRRRTTRCPRSPTSTAAPGCRRSFRETNPRYYDLIRALRRGHRRVPVVLNTSFNLKGEPIVTTPDNALNTFFASEMDTLVLGNHIVRKSENV